MNQLRPILAAVTSHLSEREEELRHGPLPFVTISRQAGAGAVKLMHELLKGLREMDTDEPAWTGWHRELVERVAVDHEMSTSLIESLEDSDHSYLRQLLGGLSLTGKTPPSEVAIYQRIAQTIRALAQRGRVILVGRGSVYVTRDLPMGTHVRLVAPLDYREKIYSKEHKIPPRDARRRVQEIDHNREVFYRQFWPEQTLGPESFHLTLNVAGVDEHMMADAIMPLVKGRRVQERVVLKDAPTVVPA